MECSGNHRDGYLTPKVMESEHDGSTESESDVWL